MCEQNCVRNSGPMRQEFRGLIPGLKGLHQTKVLKRVDDCLSVHVGERPETGEWATGGFFLLPFVEQ